MVDGLKIMNVRVGPVGVTTTVTISIVLEGAPWITSGKWRGETFILAPNLVKIHITDGEVGWIDVMGKKIKKSSGTVGAIAGKISYLGRTDLVNGEMDGWLVDIVKAEVKNAGFNLTDEGES